MFQTLRIAGEKGAYTLSDRGTLIKFVSTMKGKCPLEIVVEGDPVLLNQYSVIAINPRYCLQVRFDLAQQFISWITSPRVQDKIAQFKLLGKRLFVPNARQ